MKYNLIKVLKIVPGEVPHCIYVENKLEAYQNQVGGSIEVVYQSSKNGDVVDLICNEEGKILQLPLNRALCNASGDVVDIIAGNFLVCSHDDEGNFCSLTQSLIDEFTKRFARPEKIEFVPNDGTMECQLPTTQG